MVTRQGIVARRTGIVKEDYTPSFGKVVQIERTKVIGLVWKQSECSGIVHRRSYTTYPAITTVGPEPGGRQTKICSVVEVKSE